MITRVLALLLLVVAAHAGDHNPGPGEDEVVTFWAAAALTTTPARAATSYAVGLDRGIIVEVEIEGAEEGDTVTLTPTFTLPGQSAADAREHRRIPQATTWTQGQIPGFYFTVTPPPGAEKMYLEGVTSDTDGCTITASTVGNSAR